MLEYWREQQRIRSLRAEPADFSDAIIERALGVVGGQGHPTFEQIIYSEMRFGDQQEGFIVCLLAEILNHSRFVMDGSELVNAEVFRVFAN